jgi:catechol 2,3-dioxygenase-like lactoylglutathione lyase family enzyme
MQIEHLELLAPDLPALRDFYAGQFGLPVLPAPDNRLALQVGTSHLTFTQAPAGWSGRYHFAFTIPENQYREAKTWLAARVLLATAADGREEFHSTDWNADILYYFDPAGNIGELIARHTLDCASTTPFGPASFLSISEIGLATPDVAATVADLSSRLAVSPYGETSDTFAPVGDEHGLFIAVRTGRIWFPDTGIPAAPLPLTATVRNGQGHRYRVAATATATTIEPVEG